MHEKSGGGIANAYNPLGMIATTNEGYHNLAKRLPRGGAMSVGLAEPQGSSIGYIGGFYHRPRIDEDTERGDVPQG